MGTEELKPQETEIKMDIESEIKWQETSEIIEGVKSEVTGASVDKDEAKKYLSYKASEQYPMARALIDRLGLYKEGSKDRNIPYPTREQFETIIKEHSGKILEFIKDMTNIKFRLCPVFEKQDLGCMAVYNEAGMINPYFTNDYHVISSAMTGGGILSDNGAEFPIPIADQYGLNHEKTLSAIRHENKTRDKGASTVTGWTISITGDPSEGGTFSDVSQKELEEKFCLKEYGIINQEAFRREEDGNVRIQKSPFPSLSGFFMREMASVCLSQEYKDYLGDDCTIMNMPHISIVAGKYAGPPRGVVGRCKFNGFYLESVGVDEKLERARVLREVTIRLPVKEGSKD